MKTKTYLIITIAVVALALSLAAQKQAPPEGGKPKDFRVPAFRTFTLENGLGVTLVPYGTLPKAAVRFVIRTGNVNEAAEGVWLSDLMFDYLKEGTGSRTARAIAEEAAAMGGEVGAGAGGDQSSVGGTVLAEFAPAFVKLLADIVRNPAFPESELARLQANFLRQLAVAKTEPTSLASEAYYRLLYGDHPYGRVYPTEDMIKGYTAGLVKTFYERNIGARRTHVYVAGVFDEKAVEAAVREALGDWSPGPEVVTNIPRAATKRVINVVDRPGSIQSTIFIGRPVVAPESPDYIGLELTDSLLGGAFFSRITANIRENKGYTYAPSSILDTRFRSACWSEQADVSTEVTGAALKEIIFEIDRLGREAPAEEEVRGIQNYFAGIFVLQNSTPAGLIGQLAFLRLHGLERSYLETYVQTVYKVTPEDVRRIAGGLLASADMTVVIVGDLAKIKDQIAPFGPVAKLN
ncbi:MAG: insulinase family protein [Candidatus Aminicenantes bacterium]|nr:insulinase family protein [Candidatus Aminicenantes bacterium]